MIRQADLAEVVASRDELARLAQTRGVKQYLAVQEQLKQRLDGLRTRVKRNEEVEPGALALCLKRVPTVQWERFWLRLAQLPAVAKLVAAHAEVRKLLALLDTRDQTADFIGERLSLDVVQATAAAPETETGDPQ